MHTDNDAWYSVIVSLDMGNGLASGGDFCLGTHGSILKACHGDVFFFNPSFPHACTEPMPNERGSRLYVSFYCKSDVVDAAALSSAMSARVGNAPLSLCRMR